MAIFIILILISGGALGYYLTIGKSITENYNECKQPVTRYNIEILYEGSPIEGEYYFVDTHDYYAKTRQIKDSRIIFDLLNNSPLYDDSLKITRLDIGGIFMHADINNVDFKLNRDPRYSHGDIEINSTRIIGAFKQYTPADPKYYQIDNVFKHEPFTENNIVIDLSTLQIISFNSTKDEKLWAPCVN